MVRASFTHLLDRKAKTLHIYDRDGPMSVTNDVENVLAFISEKEGLLLDHSFAITYTDTDGYDDRIITDAYGKFVTFAPGPGRAA